MLSFNTFSHMKSDKISEIIDNEGKIYLSVKPKNHSALELAIVPKKRIDILEALEQQIQKQQKAANWEVENQSAILEQNERISKRGLFSDKFRRF